MKKRRKIILGIILILVLVLAIYTFISIIASYKYSLDKELKSVDLHDTNNLIIVAHPDDETLWGGSHINEDKYFIVCITCGKNRIRYSEIKKVSKMSDNNFLGLFYPDTTWFMRNDWKKYKKNIEKDLERIIKMKKWNSIVTHNKDGEYGHIHHKMTHRIVTDIYENNNLNNQTKLYYFGKYYSKEKIKLMEKDTYIMSSDSLKKKEKMIKKYRTQYFVTKKFRHMNTHENFQEYSEETR